MNIKNGCLYAIVFIAGASILAIEILGTRILGPFYGVSLFLWSALITVTLAALSLGYAVGGQRADKNASLIHLCYIMAGAGVWILLIPWIKYPVLFISAPFGLRFAVLTAAFFLFVPPLTLLGMVSPYAIRIGASNLGTVGRTAGNLYATSTLGGVISALLVGFLLIPNIGVNRLTFAIGAVLAITASVGLVSQRKRGKNLAAILLLLFTGVIVSWPLAADKADPAGGLIALEQSPYAEIRILDMADKRHLLIDGGVHTI
jgi:predicted membrane-bound spermidine synthase